MEAKKPVVMYESECPPVSGNRQAEMAVVHLACTVGDEPELVGDLWTRLEPRDFLYDDCRFVFTELAIMQAEQVPLTDKAALTGWFRRADVAERIKQAKLDWFENGHAIPFGAILQLVTDGDFATTAHLDWYVSELRKWRVVRGLRRLAWDLATAVDREQPLVVLDWLKEKVGQLESVANTLTEVHHVPAQTASTN